MRWINFSYCLLLTAYNEACVEEPNRLILFRMLPGRRAASELVFSLRGSHSRSRSRSRVALNGSASVSDPLELPTATTSSLNIENTLEPRPVKPRKTHFVGMTMAGDDYTVALKTTLASARGGTVASSPDRWQTMTRRILLVRFKKRRHLSPWKDAIFFLSISVRIIGPSDRLTRIINE